MHSVMSAYLALVVQGHDAWAGAPQAGPAAAAAAVAVAVTAYPGQGNVHLG